MSILDSVAGFFGGERVSIKKNSSLIIPGQTDGRELLCYRCGRELVNHDEDKCQAKGLSRRVFFGLMGASAAALTARMDGIPLPGATVQVRAYAGDMFEVETLNPFSLAWDSAKTRGGNPFKSDNGILQEGGLLEFHGQDLARPDQWLRVHRGLAEMNILGVVDKVTGKSVKYKIVRNDEAEKRVGLAMKNVMREHHEAAQGILAEKRRLESALRDIARQAESAKWRGIQAEREKVLSRFDDYRHHPTVLRKAGVPSLYGDNLVGPRGTLPA